MRISLGKSLMGAAVALTVLPWSAVQAKAQPAGDAANGATLFKQRCGVCHTVDGKPAIGPSLKAVVGRKAASTGFNDSAGLKKSGLTWTAANLDKFLTAPAALVPGTFMTITVPKPNERQDIIAFLATQK